MSLSNVFTAKTVDPVFASGGFAVTPILREPDGDEPIVA